MAKVVTVAISLDALKFLLKLPKDVELLEVRQDHNGRLSGTFDLLIEASNLDDVPKGCTVPWGRITLRNEFCAQDEITHLVEGQVENY